MPPSESLPLFVIPEALRTRLLVIKAMMITDGERFAITRKVPAQMGLSGDFAILCLSILARRGIAAPHKDFDR